MIQSKEHLCAAGNTEVPAYLVLTQKGYAVIVTRRAGGEEGWAAEKSGKTYQAGSLMELLGLVFMREVRGANWAAPDHEIDAFLLRYPLDEGEE